MDPISAVSLDSMVRDLDPNITRASTLLQKFKLHQTSVHGLSDLCSQKRYEIGQLVREMETWEDAFRIKALKQHIASFSTLVSTIVEEVENWPADNLFDQINYRKEREDRTAKYYRQIASLDFRISTELVTKNLAVEDERLKLEKDNAIQIQRLKDAEREDRDRELYLYERMQKLQILLDQDREQAAQYIDGVSEGIETADEKRPLYGGRAVNILADQPKIVHDLEIEIPGEEPLLRAARHRLLKAVQNRRDKPLYSLDPSEVLLATREHEGGRATILRGTRNNVEVAIKLVFIPADTPERVYKRIYHEGDIWVKLRHHRIVEFYGMVAPASEKQLPMLVSKWMVNGNARTYFNKLQEQYDNFVIDEEPNVLPVLGHALEGLMYLRKQKVVHGGLTGTNILIDADGTGKISDFALAASEGQEQTGSRPAPMRWSSPEVLEGEPATLESDVYSFASTIYEIVANTEPFASIRSVNGVSQRIRSGQIPEFPEIGIPARRGLRSPDGVFWTLLTRCWRVNPSERPSLEEIKTALEQTEVDRQVDNEIENAELEAYGDTPE